MSPSTIVRRDVLIPIEHGQAVSRGWTSATHFRPVGVTWHWTATWNLAQARSILGGPNAERRGEASAHYGVGRSFQEGVDRYVSLEDRSWHAGVNQTLRWDGRALGSGRFKGSRTTVGIETTNVGFQRPGVQAGGDWLDSASPGGRHLMRIQPWTEEQVEMMIAVGKEVLDRWPHIKVRDHHGHHDLCPGYKVDVAGFPFARVLRGIYGDPSIPDVWTFQQVPAQRQRLLVNLGFDLGRTGPDRDGVDGDWGRRSDAALRAFQRQRGLPEDGMWTTFACWEVFESAQTRGWSLEDIVTSGTDGPGG